MKHDNTGRIARRTPFDRMHDEQPFCQGLTERRRTTVRFLGQQSEVKINDTWPKAGEMRKLWKGITEFWTDDMPQDATWRPNRHHSNIIPLFRNHVSQNAVAMFLHLRVPSSRLSMGTEIPVCLLCHTPRMPRRKRDAWFWGCQNYPTCTAPTTTNPPVPQNLKTLLLKQQTQAVNDRIPANGCRQFLVKPWANGTATTRARSLEPTNRSRGTGERRGETASQQDGGGPRSPEQSNRSSTPGGTSNGRDGTDQETVGGELGTSWSMTAGQKKSLLGGIRRTRATW